MLKYLPLEITLSFVNLQIFVMLKQQHYTQTKVEKVEKHNWTPLKRKCICGVYREICHSLILIHYYNYCYSIFDET